MCIESWLHFCALTWPNQLNIYLIITYYVPVHNFLFISSSSSQKIVAWYVDNLFVLCFNFSSVPIFLSGLFKQKL